MPGWSGELPSKMYSGFVSAGPSPGMPGSSMWVHYVFIECESSPSTAPLLVWYNGGPGASSMFGLLVELGPFLLNDLSLEDPRFNQTGIPQLIPNPYSWSKLGNLLIVDNPPPVGFSFCLPAGPTADGNSCGPWNDQYVAQTNLIFLKNWFQEYPAFMNNDLYLLGESYAGVYVPSIVREILKSPGGLKLKGFGVGDGCIGTDVLCGSSHGPYYSIEFMHGHGQFSNQLYRTIRSNCPESELKKGNLTAECVKLVGQVWDEVGGFYDYNLYDDCIDRNIFFHRQQVVRTFWDKSYPLSLQAALNDYPCPGSAFDIWINRTDVREAINVPVDSYFFSGDNGAGFNYTETEKNLLPFYKEVLTNTNLKVLVYNGDTDPGINSFVTQDIYFDYFASVGLPQRKSWRPWTLDGKKRMGGYVTQYDQFDYVTIRGSGHMVPEYKPAAAFTLLQSWLRDREYPPFSS
uniref:Carboxypeptidase n=1 Tax=Arcella intermedia TaxID=1963864 RepID=A0A6B2L3B8_9EUKA